MTAIACSLYSAIKKEVSIQRMTINPQTLQTAINGAANAHTGLHQALHELRHGSVTEAKQIREQRDLVRC
jgi:hypothetical protein